MTIRLATLLLFTASLVPAQDLEATRGRALRALAQELVGALPGTGSEASTLALHRTEGTPPAALDAMTRVLLEEGFRVEIAPRRKAPADALLLDFSLKQERLSGIVALGAPEVPGLHWSRRFGDATWADVPAPGRLVVEGPFRSDAVAARNAARRRLAGRVRAELGLRPEELPSLDAALFGGFHHREFLAEARPEGGAAIYRSILGVELGDRGYDELAGLAAEMRRFEAREPWIRGGCAVLLVVVLGLAYLRADLRTRGYKTARLRAAFGILLIVGLCVCWGVEP